MTTIRPLVRWTNVGYRYPGSDDLAVKPASLEIRHGESVAVVGRSGSGKSTLLSLLGLLDEPTVGTYEFDGTVVGQHSDRDRSRLRAASVGFVFQEFHLLDHLTIEQNIALGHRYQPPWEDTGDLSSFIAEILAHIGLADRRHDRPSTLSGGERQRIAIARALVGNPTLILADEPTGNLDSSTSLMVMHLFEEIRDSLGVTLVIVTHDEALAARSERMLRMSDGQISDQT